MFWTAFFILLLLCATVIFFLGAVRFIMEGLDDGDGLVVTVGLVMLVIACAGTAGLLTFAHHCDNKPLVESIDYAMVDG